MLPAIVQTPRALTPDQARTCETALAVSVAKIARSRDYAREHLGIMSEYGQAVIRRPVKRSRLAKIGFPPEWCHRILDVLAPSGRPLAGLRKRSPRTSAGRPRRPKPSDACR